jgi:hypothetical protein
LAGIGIVPFEGVVLGVREGEDVEEGEFDGEGSGESWGFRVAVGVEVG